MKNIHMTRYKQDHAVKLQVADQGIELVLKNEVGVNVEAFNPLEFYNQSDSSNIKLVVYQRRPAAPRALFDASSREMVYYSRHLSIHDMRMLLSYLAGHYSERYEAVHGAGFVVGTGLFGRNPKGILLLGPSKSGKSTLAKALGDKKTLDDDIICMDRDSIYVSGRVGSMTSKNNDLYFQEEGIRETSLDRVFLLDRYREGGFIEETDSQITRDKSVFDTLPDNLKSAYIGLPPIDTNARVFVIGTKGNKRRTKKAIRSTL